jgi:hypothetical protein
MPGIQGLSLDCWDCAVCTAHAPFFLQENERSLLLTNYIEENRKQISKQRRKPRWVSLKVKWDLSPRSKEAITDLGLGFDHILD